VTASHIPDRSAICLRSRCLCGRTHATITNARRLCEDACIRSRKLEPAFFSGLVFGHTILETPKRGSQTILVIHSRRRSAIICPLAVSGKRRLLKRSLSCPRLSSGSAEETLWEHRKVQVGCGGHRMTPPTADDADDADAQPAPLDGTPSKPWR
jgi:hypothetical protein